MWKKLQLKPLSTVVAVINAPTSFNLHVASLPKSHEIVTDLSAKKASQMPFSLVFCYSKNDLSSYAPQIAESAIADAVMWFAYPKKSSKLLKSDLSRDNMDLGYLGFEAVSGVAIDEDWSALRFKRVELIKTMTRKFAKTDEGKQKVAASSRKRVAEPPNTEQDFSKKAKKVVSKTKTSKK